MVKPVQNNEKTEQPVFLPAVRFIYFPYRSNFPGFADNFPYPGLEEPVAVSRLQDDRCIGAAAGAADGDDFGIAPDEAGIGRHAGNLDCYFHALSEHAQGAGDDIADNVG